MAEALSGMMNSMRLLPAVLFLFLQFQPLVGAVMCLRAAAPVCPNHEMVRTDETTRDVPDGRIVTDAAKTPIHNCPLAQVCAASALAVLQVRAHLDIAESFPGRTTIHMKSLVPADPLAPPLPPPIA